MTVRRIKSGRGHRYTVDGEKVPGVTTILRQHISEGLRKYPGKATAEYALDHWSELAAMAPSQRLRKMMASQYEVRDLAAKRGTEIHKLGQALVAGEGEVDVPDELAGHVEAYRDWLDAVEPVTLATELVLGNRTHRFCGTGDLVADLPAVTCNMERIPAGRWLLDLKSSASGIWPETALQLCAYEHAEVFAEGEDERPMEWLQIERCGAVWIRSDSVELRPVYTGPEVWEFFLHLRWLHDHVEQMPDWVGMSAELTELLATPT
jgi:hypothetical protein